jgi:Holliday junction resolvase RusA-like endonuclease
LWIEENRRRDLDNVSGSRKFILDALVKAGVLPDDSPKYVRAFTDTFGYAKEAKVIIEIEKMEEF